MSNVLQKEFHTTIRYTQSPSGLPASAHGFQEEKKNETTVKPLKQNKSVGLSSMFVSHRPAQIYVLTAWE